MQMKGKRRRKSIQSLLSVIQQERNLLQNITESDQSIDKLFSSRSSFYYGRECARRGLCKLRLIDVAQPSNLQKVLMWARIFAMLVHKDIPESCSSGNHRVLPPSASEFY